MEDSTKAVAVSKEQASSDTVQTDEASNEETNTAEEQSPEDGSELPESHESPEAPESPELSKIDITKLPPELQSKYKEMQKAFTKDRQRFRELEKKAQLYEQLEQQRLLDSKFPRRAEKPSGETTNYLAQSLGVDVSSLEPSERQQLETLGKIVDAAVNKRVQESIAPLQNDLMTRDFKQELNDARKKFSDFDDHTGEIKSILSQNPQLGFEQAYKLATYDEAEKRGRTNAIRNLEVKKTQSSPKSTPKAKEDEEPQGFDNIFQWAKKQVGQGSA